MLFCTAVVKFPFLEIAGSNFFPDTISGYTGTGTGNKDNKDTLPLPTPVGRKLRIELVMNQIHYNRSIRKQQIYTKICGNNFTNSNTIKLNKIQNSQILKFTENT